MNKIKCRYKKVEDIIEHYGYDWSNLILDGVDFVNKDLTKITLPNDTELFEKIEDKFLYDCELPKGDYSGYNFEGVELEWCKFTEDSILPSDPELFQKIYNKSLYGCNLPENTVKEIHLYNLDGVIIDLIDYNNTLTKLQHSLIRAKYPNQVGENIELPNYEDCVDDLKEEVVITSEFDF